MDKELEGVEGKETVVGIYCMRKESIFTKKEESYNCYSFST